MKALAALAAVALAFQGSSVRRTADEVAALVDELRSASEQAAASEDQLLQAAYDEFLLQHDAFDAPNACALAEAMFAVQPATWSAFCLEGISRRSGDHARAEAVLTEQLGRCAPHERRELLERRAIARGGAGRDLEAGEDLARALARGGTDACQILALRALDEGRAEEARSLFRVLLDRTHGQEPPAWALRGWALSLTPQRPLGAR